MAIICLSGSTRFKSDFERVARYQSLLGNIVLMPVIFSHFENIELSEVQIRNLKKGHFEKIGLCDRMIVVNTGGYIGEGVKEEIRYAQALKKPIAYTEGGFNGTHEPAVVG